jgi:hypothetical protein
MSAITNIEQHLRAFAREILGHRGYEPAVEQLAEAARNGNRTAERAWQRIRSARRDTDRGAM